jgi:hypothetical protein
MEQLTQIPIRKRFRRPAPSLFVGILVGVLIALISIGGVAGATGTFQKGSADGEIENIPAGGLNITDTQARDAVQQAYPDGEIQSVDLDAETGDLVYDVELADGTEVMVDAVTGTVLGTEQDDADDAEDEDDDGENEDDSEDESEDDGENEDEDDGEAENEAE